MAAWPTRASITLDGCTISNNYASVGFNISGAGMINNGMAWLTDCTISGNTSRYGKGGGLNNTGTCTLTDCTISDNAITIGGDARAEASRTTARLTLSGCTISGNSAEGGGGRRQLRHGELTNCTIAANSAPSPTPAAGCITTTPSR